ncbi:MAG: hypothetical protein SPJ27_09170 [Candidatus Onthovivens sp.]|nr:hypothetical protein [Candidatus Onthovivens sp.]
MSRRPGSRQVKCQLFLNCGRVDMYSMEKYAKEKLQLHHDPPFRLTKHTIYEESFLLSDESHKELHRLELDNHEEYDRRMEIIRENKKILERSRR